MDLPVTFVLGFLFGLAFAWPIHRLTIKTKRRLNGYGFILDLIVGSAMVSFALSTGTAVGLVVAIIAAVTFTAYMAWSKSEIGAERLTFKGWKTK